MAPIYFEIDIKYIINRIWRKQLYLKRIKDKLYYYFAEKTGEYGGNTVLTLISTKKNMQRLHGSTGGC